MAINLQKKGKINLDKGLEKLKLELSWNSRTTIDVDASAFVCKLVDINNERTPKLVSDENFVFYGNLSNPNGSVKSLGDARSGGGDGETILIDLSLVSPEVNEIDIFLTIHNSKKDKLNFGSLTSGSVKVIDEDNGTEAASFNFGTGEYTDESVIHVINIYRNGSEWETQAIGDGRPGLDLGDIVEQYQ